MKSRLFIRIDPECDIEVGSGLDNLSIVPVGSLGRNGIKFRKDIGLIVLKTDSLGDQRLVAEIMHKNKAGDLLVNFVLSMSHVEIDRHDGKEFHIVDAVTAIDDATEDEIDLTGASGQVDNDC